jgi:hypothetical protein
MDRWVVPLTVVAANGDATQAYPPIATAGIDPATATPGQLVRCPCEGQLVSLQVATDGTNALILEVYDISGIELGINVSSATAITDTQLDAAITAGKAKLIFEQNVAGSGLTPFASVGPARFMKGLAFRAVGAAGTCKVNAVVQGGYRYLSGWVR